MTEPQEIKKRVDESWKEEVDRERRLTGGPAQQPSGAAPSSTPSSPKREAPGPEGEFEMFVSSLSMQAMMALGEMPHPMTGEVQEELEQARYLIDVLGMLQGKTKGNLTPQEEQLLEGILYELRMKYVAKTKRL